MTSLSREYLCTAIVEGSGDAILFADRKGIIRLWNAGAETIFGYHGREAIGQTLDLIVPESLRSRHWDGFDRAMARGATRYGHEVLAVPALHKNGARISIEFTVVLVRDPDGEIVGVAAVIRDVTARWQAEQALRERLERLEQGA